jgi:lysophospholipase L1-like esterase
MRVLITGDSHLARARPRHAEIAAEVTSRAIGGSVATDLAAQVANLDPTAYDVVLVSVGTNDAGWRDVPLETFTTALGDFLAWASTTPVLLMTSPGCVEGRAAEHWSSAKLTAFGAEAAALVTAAGGRVLDTPAVLASLGDDAFVEDGFHLTPAAYDLLLPALADMAARRR